MVQAAMMNKVGSFGLYNCQLFGAKQQQHQALLVAGITMEVCHVLTMSAVHSCEIVAPDNLTNNSCS